MIIPRPGKWNHAVTKWFIWRRLYWKHHRLPFCSLLLRWTPDRVHEALENKRQAIYREIYDELMETASEYRASLAGQTYVAAYLAFASEEERRICALAIERAANRFRRRRALDE